MLFVLIERVFSFLELDTSNSLGVQEPFHGFNDKDFETLTLNCETKAKSNVL